MQMAKISGFRLMSGPFDLAQNGNGNGAPAPAPEPAPAPMPMPTQPDVFLFPLQQVPPVVPPPTPPPTTEVVVPAEKGISTGTVVAIGLAALVAGALIFGGKSS